MTLGVPSVRRSALAAALFIAALVGPVSAAATLFPEPLHLTRSVDDPISGQAVIVEEYYHANRVVSVRDERTVIADYARQEVTEIDRENGTYSITSFATLAKHAPKPRVVKAAANGEEPWTVTSASPRGNARPNTEFFDATPRSRSEIRKLEVGVDRSVRLSKDALEIVVGAAYPNPRTDEAEVFVRAARLRESSRLQPTTNAAAAGEELYALPVEQNVTYEVEGRQVVMRNRITRVGNELPAPALLMIPPGAQQIESRRVQTERELDELERLPPSPPNR